MIKPVKNLHGLSPIEDWIHHSQWLEQERDKYRDACERLIGHYYGGDGYFHNVGETKFIEIDEFGDKYNFARQVEAEIKGESK